MATPSLQSLRQQIDEIDDAIHDLIMKRAEVVVHVASAKNIGDALPIRLAREASMLRRLAARHEGPFPYPSLARMWHEMIAAFTMIQARYSIVVFANETEHVLWDLARDQFGSQTPMHTAPSPPETLAELREGRADVAVLPMPAAGEADPWWAALPADGSLRIVARLPFGGVGCVRGAMAEAFAVARLPLESTGEDRTLVIVDAADDLDRQALADTLGPDGGARLGAWSAGSEPSRHLIELAGFHGEDSPVLARLAAHEQVVAARIAGVYAVPIVEPPGEESIA